MTTPQLWQLNVLAGGLAIVLIVFIAGSFMSAYRLDAYQQHINDREQLIHARVSELTHRLEELSKEVQEIQLLIDPHKRIEDVEKWQRTFCSGDKLEACAILGKVEK